MDPRDQFRGYAANGVSSYVAAYCPQRLRVCYPCANAHATACSSLAGPTGASPSLAQPAGIGPAPCA